MQIANPIYDVVFKYLMEDARVAKIFLSTITGFDIKDIEPLPQEFSSEAKSQKGKKLPKILSIYRIDFSAKIKTESGDEKLIIIEVQKCRTYSESMRFRKYLGKQYTNQSHFYLLSLPRKHREIKVGIPIYTIYFLGEALSGLEKYPVLHIDNQLVDRYGGQVIKKRDPFVDSLYHSGIIINIPALKKRRRDDLEILLSIFDQKNRTSNIHIMNVNIDDFPAQFQPIIRRLQVIAGDSEVQETMVVEDDFFNEIQEYEDRLKNALKEKEEERCQKEEERRQKEEAILLMLKSGIDKKVIAKEMDLSMEYIENIEKRG